MNNRTMLSTLKNNAAAGYQGPVKIELLKGEGLLHLTIETNTEHEAELRGMAVLAEEDPVRAPCSTLGTVLWVLNIVINLALVKQLGTISVFHLE